MPRPYTKKQRKRSYFTAKGTHHLQKALKYLGQAPDLKGSQTLKDLQAFLPVISEVHTLTLMREEGMDISAFMKQTTLETPDSDVLEILKEADP